MGLKFDTSAETCAYVRSQTDTVVLAFSAGKDSIGAWLQMRKFWTEPGQIIPVYQRTVSQPDGYRTFEFVERALAYYEEKFQTHIYRLNHVEFRRMLYYKVFQAPGRLQQLSGLAMSGKIQVRDTSYMNERVRDIPGLENTWTATGLRQVDSLQRRASIKRNGAAYPQKKLFYPIWDWQIDQLLGEMNDAGLKLPVDYAWFGRSLDGIDARVQFALREHAPDDLALLLDWYPLADIDMFRYEQRERLLKERHA